MATSPTVFIVVAVEPAAELERLAELEPDTDLTGRITFVVPRSFTGGRYANPAYGTIRPIFGNANVTRGRGTIGDLLVSSVFV